MSGFRVDTSGFQRATKALQDGVRKNTQTYGRLLAQTYETASKKDAPWVDRKGNARLHLYGTSTASSNRVTVEMGGKAPNYKKSSPLSASDYLEYLEFGHDGKYATVYPTAAGIQQDVLNKFGDAALHGKMRVSIRRNRKELNAARKQILQQSSLQVQFMLAETIQYWAWLQDRRVLNRPR